MGEWSNCIKHPGSAIARSSIIFEESVKSISNIFLCLGVGLFINKIHNINICFSDTFDFYLR